MGKAKHGGRGKSRRTRMVKRERRGGRKNEIKKKKTETKFKKDKPREMKKKKKNPNVDIERIKKRRGRRRGKEEGKPNLKRSFGCHRPERRRRMLMEEESSGNGERAAKGLTFFPHFPVVKSDNTVPLSSCVSLSGSCSSLRLSVLFSWGESFIFWVALSVFIFLPLLILRSPSNVLSLSIFSAFFLISHFLQVNVNTIILNIV